MQTNVEVKDWYEEIIRPNISINAGYPYGTVITEDVNYCLFRDKDVFKRCEVVYKTNSLYGVIFQDNYITYSSLGRINSTVISFCFTGCYMAKLMGEDSNYYACHIYSTGDDSRASKKRNWQDLYASGAIASHNCTHFKPIVADPNQDSFFRKLERNRNDFMTCGIIDGYNRCFALLLYKNDLKVVSEGYCCSKTYYAREMQPISGNI